MIDHLSRDDTLAIIEPMSVGPIREPGLLASALDRPRTTIFGQDAYPALVDKAAALVHSLARNDPLVDGNKRLAWVLTRTFVRLNDHDIAFAIDDAEQLVLGVAAGEFDAAGLATILQSHLTSRSR